MKLIVVVVVLSCSFLVIEAAKSCKQKKLKTGIVCVCDENYCDTVDPVEKVQEGTYLKYTSDKSGLRFDKQHRPFMKLKRQPGLNTIVINRTEKYQSIIGWGGAFTDATGINIKSLGKNAQQHLLKSYFSDEGIEYSVGRIPIGGTDFSTRPYTYDDSKNNEEDPDLKNFELAPEDHQYKIPFILKANKLAKNKLKLYGSAWTSPTWMTESYEKGHGFVKKEFEKTWANYHVKFIEEYDKNGVKIWGITTGNEPSFSVNPEIGMHTVNWLELPAWIANDLGPILKKSKYSDLIIMILDDNRNFLPMGAQYILQNETVKNLVDGIAIHWYENQFVNPEVLSLTHNEFPDKFIFSTEACTGVQEPGKGVVLGSWTRAEYYMDDIIKDLCHWVAGWTDWNMALNTTGGPTYTNNIVDSPIIVNASSGEFYKQPMFYGFGHFSKFLPPNSVRIGTNFKIEKIYAVAFETPEKSTVVEILNKDNKSKTISVLDESRGTISLILNPKSITTIIYW